MRLIMVALFLGLVCSTLRAQAPVTVDDDDEIVIDHNKIDDLRITNDGPDTSIRIYKNGHHLLTLGLGSAITLFNLEPADVVIAKDMPDADSNDAELEVEDVSN